MDSSIKSFKGYGKVDEIEEQAFKKKKRKCLTIVIISSIVLLALVIGVVARTITHKRNIPATEVTPAASLKAVCSVTQFPNSCFSSISSLETANTTDPKVLFNLSLHIATKNSTEFTSNSLAIVAKILGLLADFNLLIHRRLLRFEESKGSDEFPTWVSHSDRRLLQEFNVTAHVTVAKDGSGDYTSISEAVEAVPKKSSETRFVIYVKEGKYVENVVMDKSKWNVMMYGDGKDKTIVSGGLNFEFLATKFESTTEYISITKKKKKLFLALFATLLVVAAIIGIVVGVTKSHNNSSHNEISAAAHAILKNSCSSILYPDVCYSAIATIPRATAQLASKKD
ncbi:pectinesterase 1, partial [Quercus suber]